MNTSNLQVVNIPYSEIVENHLGLLRALAISFENAVVQIPAGIRHMMEYAFHGDEQRRFIKKCLHRTVAIPPLFFTEIGEEVCPFSDTLESTPEESELRNSICQILGNPRTGCLDILGLVLVWIKICQHLSQVSSIVLIKNTQLAWKKCSSAMEIFLSTDSLNMKEDAIRSIERAQELFEDLFSSR